MDLTVSFGGDVISHPDPSFVIPDEDGNWVFGLAPAPFFPTNAAAVGTWEVTATCFDAETDEVLVDYETATFEVILPPTPPPTLVPESPEAPPAGPVPAEPSFTG